MAWAVHEHIFNRTTYENIEATARDYFGITLTPTTMQHIKGRMAAYYKPACNRSLQRLINGSLLHVDETGVRLRKSSGYVWIFANMSEVIYMFRETRKTNFLQRLLKSFAGVLVTDFYTGYDFLKCPQQKCLVHLMRDLNDDVLKLPSDNELMDIAASFSRILAEILETVDRYGLRSRYLRKYRKKLHQYLDNTLGTEKNSDVAERYRRRMVKYWERMFLFIEYDGIPWNNNNGERAVKPFAKYRRLVNGRITAKGLREYLILLSLRETCQYQGLSFLDFLRSGERDIEAFAKMRR